MIAALLIALALQIHAVAVLVYRLFMLTPDIFLNIFHTLAQILAPLFAFLAQSPLLLQLILPCGA